MFDRQKRREEKIRYSKRRKENDNFLIRTRGKEIRYSFIVVTSRDLNASTIKIQKESITSPNIYIYIHIFLAFDRISWTKTGRSTTYDKAVRFVWETKKKKKEKKKIGDDPRARKIYKQGGRRLKRIPLTIVGGKLRGPTNDFKATRGGGGLDTGVGMERVSCVHHRDFLLWKMTRTDYKSTDCR